MLRFIKIQRYIEIHRMAWLGLEDGYCYSHIQSTSVRMRRLKKGKRKREGEKKSVKSMRKNMCCKLDAGVDQVHLEVSARCFSGIDALGFLCSFSFFLFGGFGGATGVSTLTLDLLLVTAENGVANFFESRTLSALSV